MRQRAAGLVVAALVTLSSVPSTPAGVGMGVIEEHPSAARERWREKAETWYKEGMKARAAGDQANAVRFLLRVAKMGAMRLDSPYPQQAYDEVVVITEEARKELLVARELVAGEAPAAGVDELKRILRTYMGLGQAKEAGKLLRQLDDDPEFQATLRAGQLAEDLKKAKALEAEADALARKPEPATDPPTQAGPEGVEAAAVKPTETTEKQRQAARIKKLAAAYEIYANVAKKGTGTEPGKQADEARKRLEQNADLMARMRLVQAEDRARQLLSLAHNYFRSGRLDTARKYCRMILEECPKTPQAAEAKVLLERVN